MKKKVLYGIFMALFAVVSMGSLQSCKDDLSDKYQQTQYDIASLKAYVEDLDRAQASALEQVKNNLQGQIDGKVGKDEFASTLKDYVTIKMLGEEIDKLRPYLAGGTEFEKAVNSIVDGKIDAYNTKIQEQFGQLNDRIAIVKDLVDDLTGKYDGLNDTVSKLSDNFNAFSGKVSEKLDSIDGALEGINDDILELFANYEANNEYLTQLYHLFEDMYTNEEIDSMLEDIYKKIEVDEEALTSFMNQVYNKDEIDTFLSTIYGRMQADEEAISSLFFETVAIQQDLYNLNQKLDREIGDVWEKLFEHEEWMSQIYFSLHSDIEDVNELVNELSGKYTALSNRLNQLITSVELQGSFNSMFGTLNLPVGIKTNILFNWYGKNSNGTFDFPNASQKYAFNADATGLTAEDFTRAGITEFFNVKEDEWLTNGNLGRVYVTVNPFGVDFENTTFKLENSVGAELPYELKLRKSNEVLSFGYSRDADNGFYEADVNMKKAADLGEAIAATRIEIEPGLKAAVKEALHDKSKRSAVNLLKAVYSQLDGLLPAYGVAARWNVDGKKNAVLSKYELAVTTAKPLSYKFLVDRPGGLTSHRVPTIGTLENLFERLIGDRDSFHFDLENMKVKDFEIDFKGLDFTFDLDLSYTGEIKVTIDEAPVYIDGVHVGNTGATSGSVDVNTFQKFLDSIAQQIENAINNGDDSLKGQINKEIQEELIANIENQVNEWMKSMLEEMDGEINGKIDEILGNIEDKINGIGDKFNRVIEIYNKVANQLNRMIADPNNYLQPALFYEYSKGVAVVSTSKADPTVFVRKGGNGICLYASSYTGELVAPAFKKFVAVTNVYNADGTVNTDEQSNIAAINKASGLNKVLEGGQKRVGIATSKMVPGLVYEIAYQGLDYDGVTSAQKFYIKVK